MRIPILRCCMPTTPPISRTSSTTALKPAGNRDHFGAGNKFITPTIAGGKVFVGTTAGVAVFGLLR